MSTGRFQGISRTRTFDKGRGRPHAGGPSKVAPRRRHPHAVGDGDMRVQPRIRSPGALEVVGGHHQTAGLDLGDRRFRYASWRRHARGAAQRHRHRRDVSAARCVAQCRAAPVRGRRAAQPRHGARRCTLCTGSEPFEEPFGLAAQAESFRSDLMAAARNGKAFDVDAGLPVSMKCAEATMSGYQLACDYVDARWPRSAATTRRGCRGARQCRNFALR